MIALLDTALGGFETKEESFFVQKERKSLTLSVDNRGGVKSRKTVEREIEMQRKECE